MLESARSRLAEPLLESGYHCTTHKPGIGSRPNETVHTVEDSPMLRYQVTKVFQSSVALQHGCRQIPEQSQ
jgi:hypothetical protein